MTAKVTVTLKPGVLDPQGKAIASGLHALGYGEVTDVRVARVFFVELAGHTADRVAEMSDKLLANPVIEDFTVEIVDTAAPTGGAS